MSAADTCAVNAKGINSIMNTEGIKRGGAEREIGRWGERETGARGTGGWEAEESRGLGK